MLRRLIAYFRTDAESSSVLDRPKGRRGWRIRMEPIPMARTRWYLSNIESGTIEASQGTFTTFGQLYRSLRGDGHYTGLASTRTSGLVALPKRFHGSPEVVERLQSKTANRSTFDLMFPPAELALLAEDGIVMGFGVGEMVPVPHGEDEEPLPPVFRRLDPEFLIWDWSSMRWYYRTVQGDVEVTPGDGRWVLHIPGGTQAPWNNGLIRALGRSYIVKEHAISLRQNYATKLANPARVAHAAAGAAEDHRRGFLQRLIAWGINTVFELPIGWDVKLLESNGRGYEVWQDEENSSNKDMTVALAGQEVTTTGGTGFANASIHQAIRADLIKGDAMALAWTINTQVIPQWVESSFDSDEQFHAVVEWDAEPAKDRVQDTQVMVQTASAITQLNRALAPYGSQVDAAELCQRYGIPIRGDIDGDGRPEVKPKLVLVDENYSEENVAA